MDGLIKLALFLGSRTVSLVLLLLTCLAVIGTFLWMQQESSQQYADENSKHQAVLAKMLSNITVSHVDAIRMKMTSAVLSPQVIEALSERDNEQVDRQQNYLRSFFPKAISVCLLDPEVDNVSSAGCMPISFATLNSVRQAKKEGSASIGLNKPGTEDAHLLLAQSVVNESGQLVGVLAITLSPDMMPEMLYADASFKGYIELQQGNKNTTVVAKFGDVNQKQGVATSSLKIPNTYWRLAYWPENRVLTAEFPSMIILCLVLIIALPWLFSKWFRIFLLKRDVSILRRLLQDVRTSELKPEYPVSFKLLESVVADILKLGQESYKAALKQGATAESISKKISQTSDSAVHVVDEVLVEESEADVVDEIQLEGVGDLNVKSNDTVTIDPAIFRAYDIRGIVGKNLDEAAVKLIGHAIGSEAAQQGVSRLVIGRDARISSESLSKALSEGILASGCDVIDIGEVTTPVMYFACEQFNTQSGVMVTGSHNPPEYNGLKIVLAGQSIAQEALQKIYQRIDKKDFQSGSGSLSNADVIGEYIERIVGDVHVTRQLKLVIDCGNGIAGALAPRLFKALGCEVVELFCEVDGQFPNHHPNPSQPENLHDLAQAVKKHGAELGLAFDGDGDRLGVVDAKGNPIWPDRLLMLFAQDVLSRLPQSIVIYDVKSSSLLEQEIENAGGRAVMCESGHSLIKNKMQELGAELAGELSGHIFIKDRWYGFDDATYAASRLLEIISGDLLKRDATGIFNSLPSRINTPEILVDMKEGESTLFMKRLVEEANFDGAELVTIDGIRAEYPNGWGLVRSSNTTPGLTLRFEADSDEVLHDIQQRFKEQILQIKPSLTLQF